MPMSDLYTAPSNWLLWKFSSKSHEILTLGLFLPLLSRYLVVTSGYLIVTNGYFSLLPVTSGYFWLLLVPRFSNNGRNNDLETRNLFAVIKKYKHSSSIIAIENYVKGLGEKSFNFSKATNNIVLRNMQKLNTRKQSPRGAFRNFAKFTGKHLYQSGCFWILKKRLNWMLLTLKAPN